MLISVAEIANKAGIYPELAGSRVLITGVGPTCGVDVARAFAEHGCRLVLQIPEPCPETDALLQILSETALELRVHHNAVDEADSATRFTQSASRAYGGLEAVINLIQISRYDLNGAVTLEEIEQLLNHRLLAASYTTQVAANRMGLTWSNGSILNVMRLPPPKSPAEAALAGIARTALASMTHSEAEKWAEQGIRVNGVAPRALIAPNTGSPADGMDNEPAIAALALFLASDDGMRLSGHVLDSEGVTPQ
ncbi:MAG: SDR family oxidoreductase, partial [Hyphomicrobiaceae bacterium]